MIDYWQLQNDKMPALVRPIATGDSLFINPDIVDA